MKIPFEQAYDLLLSADQVTIVGYGEYNERVSLCTSGGSDKGYFTVLHENDDGEDYTYDVYVEDNATVEKVRHKLTFISSDDTDNEKIELFLFKVTPLV